MEDWKWIKGYEGLYKVFRDGRVLSVERLDRFNRRLGGFMKPNYTGKQRDYLFVTLHKDGKGKRHYIHRLVADAFIPNPQNKKYVDHIDNNKENNDVANLRWVTHKENMNNPITLKRMREESSKYISQEGANNPFSRKVAMYDLDGNLLGIYDSIGQIEKKFGIKTGISRVCKGQRKQTHGYVFKYVGEPKREWVRTNTPRTNKKPILQMNLDGTIVAEYESILEAARMTGFFAPNIGSVANGLAKTYKGYKWRYK